MKLRVLAPVAALSLAGLSPAGPALADGRLAATLEKPVAAKTKIVAGGAVFVCEEASCVAAAAPSRALSVSACKVLVKAVGRVSTFANGAKTLDADALARCNDSARA